MPKTIDKTKPGDSLKERIKAVRHLLPGNWKELVCERQPEYDSLKGGNILRNVMLGKTTPSHSLCELMESIARNYQNALNHVDEAEDELFSGEEGLFL